MSQSQTDVWVRTALLTEAVKVTADEHAKALVNEYKKCREDNWDWSRASITQGNLLNEFDGEEDVTLLILDCENQYEISVPTQIVKNYSSKISDAIVMANSFHDVTGTPDNLVDLTHLHAPALVHALKSRFEDGIIYTNTGSILIAVNPFRKIEKLYHPLNMKLYMTHNANGKGSSNDPLPPHVYGIADEAFRSMRRSLDIMVSETSACYNQSVLISGESGAGKTVTTKHVLNYVAALSRGNDKLSSVKSTRPRLGNSGPSSRSVRTSLRRRTTNEDVPAIQIEQKILQSNPMLESFGNARTTRNDNSSRFGKYIELQFDKKTGHLEGTKIDTYLLEKVRLIHQGEGERNYHVFYETLAAADVEDRKNYLLDDFTAEDFKITNQSGVYDRRDKVDDLDQFDDLESSMTNMGFDEKSQKGIFETICALLHASNTTFTSADGEDSELSLNNIHVEYAVNLLGVTDESFGDALCVYYLTIAREQHKCRQTIQKAEKSLEALMKAVYSALFEYIVEEINSSMNTKKPRNTLSFIGVLDIFGFESLKTNSFEQLCINYCNETLQQHFNFYVFKSEQEEYKAEGIRWDFIKFPDNQDILDLIEMKGTGLLSILDDQCKAPGTTDKSFATRLYQTCETSPRFEASHRQVALNAFGVKHFAGSVEYDSTGFMEKNKDEVPRQLIDFLESSSKPFLKTLAMYQKKKSEASGSISASVRLGSIRKGSSRVTVGGQFKAQLQLLMKRIDQTSPHYIRCLKPNSLLVPNMFMSQMISEQLESAGVLEAIRVSRVGYPQRFSHEHFFNQFHFIGRKQMSTPIVQSMDFREKCEVIIHAVTSNLSSETNGSVRGFQLGKTKVFLLQSAFVELENQRAQALEDALSCIQSQIRRHIAQKKFKKKLEKVILIQSCFRMLSSKRKVTRMLLQKKLKERQMKKREEKLRLERDLLRFQSIEEDEEAEFDETTTTAVPTVVGVSDFMANHISHLSLNSTDSSSIQSMSSRKSEEFSTGKKVSKIMESKKVDKDGNNIFEKEIHYHDGSIIREISYRY